MSASMSPWAPIIISVLAFLISLISLWKNYLAPFKLEIAHDSPTFSIYTISQDEGRTVWWIPSIDVGFTFYNLGTKLGRVYDVRILAELITDGQRITTYPFYAKWIVDFARFNQSGPDRWTWIREAITRDWFPLLLKGGEQQYLHLILEGHRWDTRLRGDLSLTLEIYSSQKNTWVEYAEFRHALRSDMYDTRDKYTVANPMLAGIRTMWQNWC